MNNFKKIHEMSQNRLNWVGIDLTSVPAKFGDPGTSRTVTKEVYWSASDPLIFQSGVFNVTARACHEVRPCACGSQHEVGRTI